MIIMTGLIIAIKDKGCLALSSIAVQIYVLHICMCRKVPLLGSLDDSLTLSINRSLTPLLGMGPGPLELGKIASF